MLLTIKDVMSRLQLSRATVYRLIEHGTLRPIKVGSSLRFDERVLEEYLQTLQTPAEDGLRVLLVEDDPATVELVMTRLESLHYRVTVASCAEEGRRIAQTTPPDLILLDLRLDGDTQVGVTLLRELRSNPATAAIPVLLHSAYVSGPADVPEAQHLADGFIPKPLKPEQFSQLVDDLRKVPGARVRRG